MIFVYVSISVGFVSNFDFTCQEEKKWRMNDFEWYLKLMFQEIIIYLGNNSQQRACHKKRQNIENNHGNILKVREMQ